jgi:curved DNA-binding protein CbpA
VDYSKDYYAILGILPSADEAIIKAVYRALAKKWHPDTFVGDKRRAEEKLKEINEAYGVLSNATSRADYDARRNASSGQQREYDEPDAEERAPFEAERAADWKFVLEYYPAVENMRAELALFSNALALTFQVSLLELKAFAQAERIKSDLISQFLRTYFGKNEAIQAFAERLIRTGAKDSARELNRLIRVSGSPTDADARRIIDRISEKLAASEEAQRAAEAAAAAKAKAQAAKADEEAAKRRAEDAFENWAEKAERQAEALRAEEETRHPNEDRNAGAGFKRLTLLLSVLLSLLLIAAMLV